MKKILLSLFLTSFFNFNVDAQAKVNVDVISNSFASAAVTINVGDTVEWTNFGGTHNVNGTTATYASNPVGFGNGAPSSSAWVYNFKFNVAGTYDYRCDLHFGGGMTGTVTVLNPGSINESDLVDNAVVYPNPFSNNLSIKLDKTLLDENVDVEFILYDLLGNQVQNITKINSELTHLNTEELSSGIYIYAFKSGGKTLKTGKLRNN